MKIKKDYSKLFGNFDVQKFLDKPKKKHVQEGGKLIGLGIATSRLLFNNRIIGYNKYVEELPEGSKPDNENLPTIVAAKFYEDYQCDDLFDIQEYMEAKSDEIVTEVLRSKVSCNIGMYCFKLIELLTENGYDKVLTEEEQQKYHVITNETNKDLFTIILNIVKVFSSVREDFDIDLKDSPLLHYPLEYFIKIHEALLNDNHEVIRDVRYLDYDFMNNLLKGIYEFRDVVTKYTEVPTYKDFVENLIITDKEGEDEDEYEGISRPIK